MREGEKTLGALLEEKQAALARRRAAGSTDRDALFAAGREVERLAALPAGAGARKKRPRGAGSSTSRRCSSRDVQARADAAAQTDRQLANAFAFLDAAMPDSQELVLFATELTANFFTSWFIQNFGCDAYYAHNQKLLFDDAHQRLLGEIRQAEQDE